MALVSFKHNLMKDCINAIQECLVNIRNTNSFMLMIINRIIDYTKATKGLKLVPRNETIDLWEALQLPLLCMTTIQTRIGIECSALPKEVCSHVITDKQWLQENLLCLVSNAVKYSTSGSVTIKVTLVTPKRSPTLSTTRRTMVPDGESYRHSTKPSAYNDLESTTIKSARFDFGPKVNPEQFERGSPDSIRSNGLENGACAAGNWSCTGGHAVIAAIDYDLEHGLENDEVSLKHKQRVNSMRQPSTSQPVADFSINNACEVESSPIKPRSPVKSEGQYFLKFEVEDTGIGMPEEAMKSLFKPFKQTQRLAGGTGLGLFSLAKRVEALHGEFGVSKRKDKAQGTLFWFTIPYRPDIQMAHLMSRPSRKVGASSSSILSSPRGSMDPYPSIHNNLVDDKITREFNLDKLSSQLVKTESCTEMTGATSSIKDEDVSQTISVPFKINTSVQIPNATPLQLETPGRKMKVLVVDDSPAILKMTSMMLKKIGFEVSTADNGQVAIQSIQDRWNENHFHYDVILMDLQMPVMDGLEATRRIRALEQIHTFNTTSSTPYEFLRGNVNSFTAGLPRQIIIGMSANSDYETAEQALQIGMNAFLAKPFKVEAFSDLVKQFCSFE